MSGFDATEARILHTRERFAGFPRDAAVLVRLIKHIHAHVQDAANAALREHDLNHTDYNILMMIYGSADNAVMITAWASNGPVSPVVAVAVSRYVAGARSRRSIHGLGGVTDLVKSGDPARRPGVSGSWSMWA